MKMEQYRNRQVTGCVKCQRETHTGPGECCPYCGGTFLEGKVVHDYVIKEEWVKTRRVWWKPFTWRGGKWKRIN